MFSPRREDLPRGWPGRIDGDRVVQLAAQTLQAFFTGGGDGARARRVSARRRRLARAGAASADGADLRRRRRLRVREPRRDLRARGSRVPGAEPVERVAAVIGADGAIGGFTLMNDWFAPELHGAKTRDFALSLGPIVATPDERFRPGTTGAARRACRRNTRLYPGDLVVR